MFPAVLELNRLCKRHEGRQLIEDSEEAAPQLPCCAPPRSRLRDQQDEPALQGTPGLSDFKIFCVRFEPRPLARFFVA